MNNRQLAQVGLGLLGVWALLNAVSAFIQIAALVGVSFPRLAVAEVVPVGLMLGLSYILIFHNAKVASAILPDVGGASEHVPSDLARTLIALTGVLLLAEALPTVINTMLNYATVGATDAMLRPQLVRRFIGSLAPLGVGIYLIARPQRLLDYVQRPTAEYAANVE
jgi:hypothetical protein